jgi:hypothetical protein
MHRPLSRAARVLRTSRHGFVHILVTRTEVPSLERAGDLSLDLGTHCQRETFSSIVTHVQTYLSKSAAWSYHYAQHFHVLFLLFYQTIEASQAS